MPNFDRTINIGSQNLGELKAPPPTNADQVADQFLQSIDLSVHLVCAKAPPLQITQI